jgi:hypothetical protein
MQSKCQLFKKKQNTGKPQSTEDTEKNFKSLTFAEKLVDETRKRIVEKIEGPKIQQFFIFAFAFK